jgi:hypothetical protein
MKISKDYLKLLCFSIKESRFWKIKYWPNFVIYYIYERYV